MMPTEFQGGMSGCRMRRRQGVRYRLMSYARRVLKCSVAVIFAFAVSNAHAEDPLNVILILADDLGYGDLGVTGARGFKTPNIDRLGREGVVCTSFMAASPVCSASRAGLLTSRYPPRTGVVGVISRNQRDHLPLEEVTLAERFREHGYATGIFGKWHLGNHAAVWPLEQGFDEWQGTVGSNDMGPGRPSLQLRRAGKAGVEWVTQSEVSEINPDQTLLTRRTTDLAIDFIDRNQEGPFFLYLPYNMPHTPLFVSDAFSGSTVRGLYGDVIAELDDSVGRILDALERFGKLEHTIIAFTSDNGPWLIFGDHGGSNGGLSGGKKQTLEGGMRVPLVIRFPQSLKTELKRAQLDSRLCSGLDVGPTLFSLAGLSWNDRVKVDGSDISARWRRISPQEERQRPFFYFFERQVRAIQYGLWKLQVAHTDRHTPDVAKIGHGGVRGSVISVSRPQALYHVGLDPGEQVDRLGDAPTESERLSAYLDVARAIAATPKPAFLKVPEE